MSATETRRVAEKWFEALPKGDVETIISCLDPDVEWINYRVWPGLKKLMPWIGTYRGIDQVLATFKIFLDLVEVEKEEVVRLIVDGEEAAGVIHEISLVKETGMRFEIEFIQWLTVRNGKIVRWKSYTDCTPILVAMWGKAEP